MNHNKVLVFKFGNMKFINSNYRSTYIVHKIIRVRTPHQTVLKAVEDIKLGKEGYPGL